MGETTRRTFIKQTGVGLTGLATLGLSPNSFAANAEESESIPPHRVLAAPGAHAYAMQHSIVAGETLELCVSTSVPFRMSICRLGKSVDDPAGDEVLNKWTESPARPQPIHPGSYVHVENRLTNPLPGVTLECWVRPWVVAHLQGLITQEDQGSPKGIGLSIDERGRVRFFLGNGNLPVAETAHVTQPEMVTRDHWHHVAATWEGTHKRVFVDGRERGAWDFAGPLDVGSHPLRIGAIGVSGAADRFLDGDLAMPAIYGSALTAAEIQAHYKEQASQPARGADQLACWPLAEEQGARVADTSGQNRHGKIINHATWMIGGPSFQANVPRFGDYDPKNDPRRGHGLRLASDDLYDCRWPVSHRWRVPDDARPGLYVARMEFSLDGKPRLYDHTFIVRRASARPRAPIVLITATTTWRAYNGTPFAVTPANKKYVWGTGGLYENGDYQDAAGLPAYCLYRCHAAGQGTYQLGLRMPWPAAAPYVLYGDATDYSHLMRADRFTQIWLEQQGYDFDIVSNEDLHRDPGLLRRYRACLILGHNEYWSRPMYDGVENYLNGGGNLIVLSGNTMGWRVSFNDDCSIMECRKVDAGGSQMADNRRGEAWHSHDGRRGGAQRECGMPGYRLIGLDCLGWISPGNPKNYGPYVVEHPDHFLFTTPEPSGLREGDRFCEAEGGKMPMANGHEFDIRPSTFAAMQEQPPPNGAAMPEDPPGIVRIANGIVPWREGGSATDYFFRSITPKTDQGGR